jgi:hypothetical protein
MLILQHFDEILFRRLQNKVLARTQRVFNGSIAIVWWDLLLDGAVRMVFKVNLVPIVGIEGFYIVVRVETLGVIITVTAIQHEKKKNCIFNGISGARLREVLYQLTSRTAFPKH